MEGDTLELLAAIRQNGFIPAAQATFTDAQTLASATAQLRGYILPKLMSRRGEFYTGAQGRYSIAVQEGVSVYRIPTRGVGAKLRSARLLDDTGEPVHLNMYEWEEVARWPKCNGTPYGLTVEGGNIRLYPTPQGLAGWTLELGVFIRPAALVIPTDAVWAPAFIVNTALSTSTLTIPNTTPLPVPLDLVGSKVDVVSATSPFETLVLDSAVVSTTDDGTNYVVVLEGVIQAPDGAWVCLPGTAPVVQLPLEWHPMLVLKTATSQLSSLGDSQMAAMKLKELEGLEANSGPLVTPRRDDAGRKVKNGMNKWGGQFGGGYW